MIHKAIAVPLVLFAFMFVGTSFAEDDDPRMARILSTTSLTLCTDLDRANACYAMIAAVAEMSRVVGETAANCGENASSKVCISSKVDNMIIQNWYGINTKK